MENISDLGEKTVRRLLDQTAYQNRSTNIQTILKNNVRRPRHMINSKRGDAKYPILTSKMISYLRSTHQHRTEEVMKLFEPEIFLNYSVNFISKLAIEQWHKVQHYEKTCNYININCVSKISLPR